jgi:hypothetical protein
MEFDFTVHVSIEREEGKFASRDEMAEQISDALESADPGSLDGEAGGSYSVVEWNVDEDVPVKPSKKASQPPTKGPSSLLP